MTDIRIIPQRNNRRALIAMTLTTLSLSAAKTDHEQVYAQASIVIERRIEHQRVTKSPNTLTVIVPEGVMLTDGLTEEEAVAVALWNNATFNSDLTALGFARADLKEAGLLSNPILSVLFPVGPKQLEAAINLPFEVLWQRPRRIAAAKVNVQRVAASLEQNALNLVRDVRLAYADLRLAEERSRLAAQALGIRRQIPTIMQARLRVGDISELEMNVALSEARTAEEAVARLKREIDVVKERFRFLLGLSAEQIAFEIVPPTSEPTAADNMDALLRDAFAARPDLRAAELSIEAAGKRAKWERSKILSIFATLDINGQGTKGFEAGPGIGIDVPIFDRNQGGISRAEAEIDLAMRQYALVRQRIASEVREARAQLVQAREALNTLREQILPPLEAEFRLWQAAYKDGEIPFLFVLQNRQRLDATRIREAEVTADLLRAKVQLDRSTGRNFGGK